MKRIFRAHGRRMEIRAGTILPHGVDGSWVGLLEKGLGAFTFTDNAERQHIFALIIPGRVFGDLDALTRNRLNLQGKVIRNSNVLLLERSRWEQEVERSPELLKLYAKTAISKQESHMEGMIANFTLDVPNRVRALMRSVIEAYYPVKASGWNPLPVNLNVTEISQTVAANRSSVSIILSEWLAQDLIRKDGRRLIVSGSLLTSIPDWTIDIPADDPNIPVFEMPSDF